MSEDRYFEGTCEPTNKVNCPTGLLMDPCDCKNYYQCANLEVVKSECGNKALFDHTTGNCGHENEIKLLYPCEADVAWTRCNVTDARMEELEYYCTNKTQTTTPNDVTSGQGDGSGSGGIGAGEVIGLIAAGAVLALILIALSVVIYRRRRRKMNNKGPTMQNPEYFEGGNSDSPYHVIDDNMHVPVHVSTSGGRQNGTLPDTPTYFEPSQGAVYDNSAFREPDNSVNVAENPGYTESLRRSVRSYERLDNSSSATNSVKSETRSNVVDENGNKGKVKSNKNGDTSDSFPVPSNFETLEDARKGTSKMTSRDVVTEM